MLERGRMSTVAEGVFCAEHPRNPAVATCGRCGAFRCAECPTNPFFADHCSACTQRVGGKASTRAMVAVVLAAVSVGCYFPPLAIAGVVLGNAEIAAINRGEAPEAGRTYAQAARIIGFIGIGLTVVLVGIIGAMFVAAKLSR